MSVQEHFSSFWSVSVRYLKGKVLKQQWRKTTSGILYTCVIDLEHKGLVECVMDLEHKQCTVKQGNKFLT